MVAKYNALPLSVRQGGSPSVASRAAVQPYLFHDCGGQAHSYWVTNWYGPSFYANECDTTAIYDGLVGATAGSIVAATLCGGLGPGAPICVAAAAALSAASGLIATEISNVDTRNHGVWFTWFWGVTGLIPDGVTTG